MNPHILNTPIDDMVTDIRTVFIPHILSPWFLDSVLICVHFDALSILRIPVFSDFEGTHIK